MKQNFIYTIACLACIWYGCGDFLAESSQDEVRPSSLEDLKQLMLYEAYPLSNTLCRHLDFLTDDIQSNWPKREDQKTVLNSLAPVFQWETDMDERVDNMNYWELYYKRIKGCNVVLDMVDDLQGETADRENMRGQALALRAYYYFMLVNLYGQPYNGAGLDLETSPGVPLILSSGVTDVYPERNTLGEVYRQIEGDLLKSLPLLEKYGTKNDVYRVTDLFAHAVLARMYLYQEQWEKVVRHTDYVLQKRNGLVRLGNLLETKDLWGIITIDYNYEKNVYDVNSIENIWSYSAWGEYANLFQIIGFDFPPAYMVSDDLYSLYEYNPENTDNFGDLRVRYYYEHCGIVPNFNDASKSVTRPHYGRKGNPTKSWNTGKGIRVAEMYLMRAEANIRMVMQGSKDKSVLQEVIRDLNYLRECRYDIREDAYVPKTDFPKTEDLLKFCLEERRRELCFEDHRWFDLRRYGMPAFEHTITLEEGNPKTVRLEERDKRYVLQIPKAVIDRNFKLTQNPK